MATFSKLAVVVAQHGADLSTCLARHADVPYEVVQQSPEETPAQLAQRVRERLAHLSHAGSQVQAASFVARQGFGVRDVMAVAGLVRGLVSAVVALGAGQVHLHAQPKDLQTHYALTALADAIREQLQGTGVSLVAEFKRALSEPSKAATASAASAG